MKRSDITRHSMTAGAGTARTRAADLQRDFDGNGGVQPGEETVDSLFQGRLKIRQSRAGYRFSLDSPLLAQFTTVSGAERAADLGAGNGVLALALACMNPLVRVTGIEIQAQMVDRARANVRLNGLQRRVAMCLGDVRNITRIAEPESFDLIVCNPPFRERGSGRLNSNREKQIARHEILGVLSDFLGAAARLLCVKGRVNMIYPAGRSAELLASMRKMGTEPKRLRMVHSFAGTPASLILVEGIKGARSGMEISPPLVVYTKDKKYTSEIEDMLRGPSRWTK